MSKRAGTRENVRVVCRVRPANAKELAMGPNQQNCVKYNGKTTIEVTLDDAPTTFNFDRVFGPDSIQQGVFDDTAAPLISDVLQGYNGTIFAYGQTGTGKTHTMEGNIHDANEKGIIPRSVEALFEAVLEADENIEFTFKVSYVEIYMERIRDLLDDTGLKLNLTIREDKIKGIFIAGVTEEYVTSHEELLQIMGSGAMNRATAATGMNEGSSRSHSVFTITVGQKDLSSNVTKSGKLVLVDLAGSEMVRKTNATGQQLEEAKTINKSLSALGQVINALTDEKQTHVPYRDSKLTRILQDSLGGNSKTVLIVAVSPSSYNANETISTLRFGTRAKSIENKVTVNQTRSVEELEALLIKAEKAIDAQFSQIVSLTNQLQAVQSVSGGSADPGTATAVANAAASARAEADAVTIQELRENVIALTQELDDERQESLRKDGEVAQLTQLLKEKERLLQEAGELLLEAQRHYESQRERSEQVVREKAEAIGELESVRSQMSDEIAKMKFDIQESEVTIETLRAENDQLKSEIAEMGGDTQPNDVTKRTNAVQLGVVEPVEVQKSAGESAEVVASSFNFEERKAAIESAKSQFASVCADLGINGTATSRLGDIIHSLTDQQLAMVSDFDVQCNSFEKAKSEHAKRIKDMETQRSRLEKDLQSRAEKVVQQNMQMDQMRGPDGSDFLSERERSHMKSLQQRLEQLVAVHRQLLRKFASLELENGEFKKKIQLRDERIRQLEGNSRGLTGSMRQQAERHVAELTNLREQIQILRSEHQQRLEVARLHDAPGGGSSSLRHEGPRSIRGGTHGPASNSHEVPKIVRGGGGVTASKSAGEEPVASTGSSKSGGLFSRFLGQK